MLHFTEPETEPVHMCAASNAVPFVKAKGLQLHNMP